jgi:alcohol dehydrogenase
MIDNKLLTINANIVSGERSLKYLPKYIKNRGFKYPAIIVDKNLYDSSRYVSALIDSLVVNSNMLFFYDYPFEPSYQYLDSLMVKIRENNMDMIIDLWIGVGGGSTMDTAKGLAILCKNKGTSTKYKGFPEKLINPIPTIAVPSTTGTGSEIVYNASFIDEKTKIKMGINYKSNYPILAILDPLIPSSAPKKVLESSGCDTLVHALEAFMSVKTNIHVQHFSRLAINITLKNMKSILEGNGDINNWENMQWASVYAMFALSNSTAGPSGALSYYLGTNFKVNHGIAGGAFIGKLCKYNHENGYHDLSSIYERSNVHTLNTKQKSEIIVSEILELLDLAKIPTRLDSFGVRSSDLNGFNEFATRSSEAFNYNPIKINLDRVSELFVEI